MAPDSTQYGVESGAFCCLGPDEMANRESRCNQATRLLSRRTVPHCVPTDAAARWRTAIQRDNTVESMAEYDGYMRKHDVQYKDERPTDG